MSKLPEEICKVIRETRDVYTLTATEDEVQDAWVRIIITELDYPEHADDLAATKMEFHMRMEYAGIQYINFDKAMKALNLRTDSQVGRVQDVNDNI